MGNRRRYPQDPKDTPERRVKDVKFDDVATLVALGVAFYALMFGTAENAIFWMLLAILGQMPPRRPWQ